MTSPQNVSTADSGGLLVLYHAIPRNCLDTKLLLLAYQAPTRTHRMLVTIETHAIEKAQTHCDSVIHIGNNITDSKCSGTTTRQ